MYGRLVRRTADEGALLRGCERVATEARANLGHASLETSAYEGLPVTRVIQTYGRIGLRQRQAASSASVESFCSVIAWPLVRRPTTVAVDAEVWVTSDRSTVQPKSMEEHELRLSALC